MNRLLRGKPPETIGPYRLIELLGRGGMAVVYRACRLETGEMAALKTVAVPQEWMLAGIRREIHALSRLRHPGIVRIVAEGLEQGLPWYAMELVEGLPLRQYCAQNAAAPTELDPTAQALRSERLRQTRRIQDTRPVRRRPKSRPGQALSRRGGSPRTPFAWRTKVRPAAKKASACGPF
jgi:hypothetical protein